MAIFFVFNIHASLSVKSNSRAKTVYRSEPYLSIERNSHLLWFCIIRLVIGLKNSRHFLNQSEVNPKPIAILSRMFSRASCRLHAFASSFDWFAGLSVSFLIGQSDYLGFGLTTLNRKSLYCTCV